MSFLREHAQRRLGGGPAERGAFGRSVQLRLTALDKMQREEQRYLQAIQSAPDLHETNPEAAEALTQYQMASRWGSTDEKIAAQESLWRNLVQAPGVRHTLSAVAWVGKQFERGDRAAATFIRGALGAMELDVQARASFLTAEEYQQARRILRAYDEVPTEAPGLVEKAPERIQRFIESIPPEYRPVLGMSPWERLTAGLSLDPQSLTIGESLITDEAAERPIGLFGLKAGHMRLPLDIGLSPLTWLTGSGAARPVASILSRADDPARALSRVRASGVKVPVGTKTTGYRARVLTEQGLETWTEAHRRMFDRIKASRERYLKSIGWRAPGKTDQAQAMTEEAHRYANDIAMRSAAHKVGRLLDTRDDILDKGGLYFSAPFFAPVRLASGAAIVTPGRYVYERIARHAPGLGDVLDRTVDFFDRAFNEVPKQARRVAGYDRLKATMRANQKRSIARLHADIDAHFGDIPSDQAEAIGHYLQIRGSRRIQQQSPEEIQGALRAINPEYRDSVVDIVDSHYIQPFAQVENELRVLTRERSQYFPQRYRNHDEMSLAVHQKVLSDPNLPIHISARVVPEQGFAMERVFDDYIEAVQYAKDNGVELEPILDFREALKVRAKEHVNAVEGARLEHGVVRRFGRHEKEVDQIVFRQVFPEWEEAVEQTIASAGRVPSADEMQRATRIGGPLKLFDELLPFGINNKSSKNARQLRNAIGRGIEQLDETDKAVFVLGAMRTIGRRNDLGAFEDFLTAYDDLVSRVSGKSLMAARARVRASRDSTLGEHVDRFGRQFVLVKNGPIEGHYIPQGIYDDIREGAMRTIPKAIQDALRTTDLLTDVTKWGLTAPWPSFHTRNAYSNVAQAFLEIGWASMNPVKWRHALGVMKGHDGTVMLPQGAVPYSIMRRDAEIYGVIRPAGTTLDYIDAEGALRQTLSGGGNTPLTKAMGAGSRAGQWNENIARTQLFVHYRMQGLTPEHAAAAVDKTFFDYGSLSWFDQNIFKRIFPFWCVPDDCEILTREGWKTCDELIVGEDVMSYNVAEGTLHWGPCKDKATFPYSGVLMTLVGDGRDSYSFTPDHRWPIIDHTDTPRMVRGYELRSNHRIPRTGTFIGEEDPVLDERTAAIIGWLVTDGYIRKRGGHVEMMIYQSPKKHLNKIIDLLGDGGRAHSPHPDTGVVCVNLVGDLRRRIAGLIQDKNQIVGLVTRMGPLAAKACLDAMVSAEGSENEEKRQVQFVQKPGAVMDAFQILAQMTERVAHSHERVGRSVSVAYLSMPGRRVMATHKKIGAQWYSGRVWCPVTEHGTWVMRRRGRIIITGNTWNKKNVAFTAKQLKQHPGRWSAMVRVLGESMEINETGADEAFLPEYALGTVRIGLGGDEGVGRFLTGIDLPVESALELAWPVDLQQSVRSWVSMVHPARSIFDAYGWQRDPFTGEELGKDARKVLNGMGTVIGEWSKALGPAGEEFRNLMEYKTLVDDETGQTFRTVNAAKYHVLMKGAFLARMAGTTDRFQNYIDSEGIETTNLLLDLLGGIRLREYDLTKKQERLLKENISLLKRLGVRTDRLYEFPVFGISRRTEVQ